MLGVGPLMSLGTGEASGEGGGAQHRRKCVGKCMALFCLRIWMSFHFFCQEFPSIICHFQPAYDANLQKSTIDASTMVLLCSSTTERGIACSIHSGDHLQGFVSSTPDFVDHPQAPRNRDQPSLHITVPNVDVCHDIKWYEKLCCYRLLWFIIFYNMFIMTFWYSILARPGGEWLLGLAGGNLWERGWLAGR